MDSEKVKSNDVVSDATRIIESISATINRDVQKSTEKEEIEHILRVYLLAMSSAAMAVIDMYPTQLHRSIKESLIQAIKNTMEDA